MPNCQDPLFVDEKIGDDTLADFQSMEMVKKIFGDRIDSVIGTGGRSVVFSLTPSDDIVEVIDRFHEKTIREDKKIETHTDRGLCIKIPRAGLSYNNRIECLKGIAYANVAWSNENNYPPHLRNGSIDIFKCGIPNIIYANDYHAAVDKIFSSKEGEPLDNLSDFTVSLMYQGDIELREIQKMDNVDHAILHATSTMIAWLRLADSTPNYSHNDLNPRNVVISYIHPTDIFADNSTDKKLPWARIIDFDTASEITDHYADGCWHRIMKEFNPICHRMLNDRDCACMNALYVFFQSLEGDGLLASEDVAASIENDGLTIPQKALRQALWDRTEAALSKLGISNDAIQRSEALNFISTIIKIMGDNVVLPDNKSSMVNLYANAWSRFSEAGINSHDIRLIPLLSMAYSPDSKYTDIRSWAVTVLVLLPFMPSLSLCVKYRCIPAYPIFPLLVFLILFYILPSEWTKRPLDRLYKRANFVLIASVILSSSVDLSRLNDADFYYFVGRILAISPYVLFMSYGKGDAVEFVIHTAMCAFFYVYYEIGTCLVVLICAALICNPKARKFLWFAVLCLFATVFVAHRKLTPYEIMPIVGGLLMLYLWFYRIINRFFLIVFRDLITIYRR